MNPKELKDMPLQFNSEIEHALLSTAHVLIHGNKRYVIPLPIFRFEEDELRSYRIDTDIMPLTALAFFDWKYRSTSKQGFPVYQRENYFLIVTKYGEFNNFEIGYIDPSIVDRIPDPEHFRIVVKHPTVSQFLNLQQLLDFENSPF